jgi:hypothetical protein
MELKLIEVARRQRRRTLKDAIACVVFSGSVALVSGLLLAM